MQQFRHFWFTLSLGVTLMSLGTSLHAQEITPVTTKPAADVLIAVNYETAAVATSANVSDLAAQVAARVIEIHADVGDSVSEGDLLISLDPRDFRLQLAAAKAELARTDAEIELAASRLARSESLAEDAYVSADSLAELRAQLAMLKAQRTNNRVSVDIAQAALDDTRIVAPFSGSVTARPAQLGALLTIGATAVRVIQTNAIEVSARSSDGALEALRSTGEATFHFPGHELPVELARIAAAMDNQTRQQEVRLLFTTESAIAGQPGRLRWQSGAEFIPVPYVQRRNGQLGVFVAAGETARFVALPDAEEGRPARWTGDQEQLIIDRGRERLQDGDLIRRTTL
ncbi:MAG: efflux RND transporter periplasmic adaptor subunit [Pseudomonadota bacterium]